MSHRAVTQVNAEVAPKTENLEAEPSDSGRRPQGPSKAGRRGGLLQRGGSDSTVTRTRRATGETLLVPSRNRRNQVGRITGAPGKSAEGERVEDGSVVAAITSPVVASMIVGFFPA